MEPKQEGNITRNVYEMIKNFKTIREEDRSDNRTLG